MSLVGSRLGRAFLSLYYYLGVRPRSSERVDGFSRVRERRRAEADEDHGPGWTLYWREERCPSVCSGGHALGAVFNQLVRSRAQLLLLE